MYGAGSHGWRGVRDRHWTGRALLAIALGSGLILGCGSNAGDAGQVEDGLATAAGSGAGGAPGAAAPDAQSGAEGGAEAPDPASDASGAAGAAGEVAGSGASGAGGAALPGAAGAAAGEGAGGASGAAPDAGADASAPSLPPATRLDADGPFDTTQDLAAGPRGLSGLFHPAQLGQDGVRHPIFVWGCGGGSNPSAYAEHLNRIASHGFVVIAEVSMIGDDGDVLTASLDWILAENERPESMFHGKLDTARVAAGGHSIGSVNTFLMADDPRLLTTIHVAGGSLDDVNDPFAPTSGMGGMRLVHPAALICSETDLFGNVEKTAADYEATGVPVFFTVIAGADHVGAAREGLPAMVGWLRWHVLGEEQWRSLFLDPAGEFRTGKYVSQIKNW